MKILIIAASSAALIMLAIIAVFLFRINDRLISIDGDISTMEGEIVGKKIPTKGGAFNFSSNSGIADMLKDIKSDLSAIKSEGVYIK